MSSSPSQSFGAPALSLREKKAAFERVLRALEPVQRAWVVAHIHPDPDAVGSVLAMGEFLRRQGKSVELLLQDPVPRVVQYLPGVERIRSAPNWEHADALIVLDVAELARIGSDLAGRVQVAPLSINIDHHTTGKRFADVECIVPSACATAEILFDLFRFADVPIDRTLAEFLYAGIIGDTGNFRFSNTTARAHEIAAELIRAGVRPHEAYEHIYGSNTAGQIQLLGMVLETLRLYDQGRIATIQVRQEMYRRTGTTVEDVDGFSDYARSVEGVWAVAFFNELSSGKIKVSLRSRYDSLRVDRVAKRFGGGGHPYAAGCLLPPPIEEAERRVVAALEELIREISDDSDGRRTQFEQA